jgi:hypothetical protein
MVAPSRGAPPLPLAGEGWGGGSLRESHWQTNSLKQPPPASLSLGTLPRKREREESYCAARYSAACCATVGWVPATVARRMSRGCVES